MADTPHPAADPSPPARRAEPETVDLSPADREAMLEETTPEATVGRSFGDYELLGEIERGGMGIVYKARERHSGRLVALKMMLSETATGSNDLRRFILEARATGELNHPGIVTIHAWGEHDGHPFYTMDFVPGVPLGRLLQQGPLPWERAVRYLLGIAQAVAAAHHLGIVHRDLKPGNVIIDPSDQPRVLDFGLAKRRRAAASSVASSDEILDALAVERPSVLRVATSRDGDRRTEDGAILGTPAYMAPEQARAEHHRVGPAADVHALGALFFEMLTGRPPFQGETTYETLLLCLHEEAPPLRQHCPEVPPALEELCQRCLEKDPRERYPHAGALADDLERRWQRAVRAARFARLAPRAALALLLLAVAQFLLRNGPSALWLQHLLTTLGETTQLGPPLPSLAVQFVHLLGLVVLVVAPYLAEVGLLVWLTAWVRNAEDPKRIVLVAFLAAALAGLLAVWPGMAFLASGPLFLAPLLAVNALVAGVAVLHRWWTDADRVEPEGRSVAAEPYLQKLFTVRAEARQRTARAAGAGVVGLADFELGRILFHCDGHEVRWARQKSLDRPTLVWLDHQPPVPGTVPGVVVRHPSVLNLHAVGTGPEGRYLVTEFVAASPLSELLQQRGLVPLEAAALTAQLARALQAFHDHGACHGRLAPEWVLVRGDLEPLLCPCGFPSQTADEREGDVRALGKLLEQWLPPRPRSWRYQLMAPLYHLVDAVAAGRYHRPGDLADDLEWAGRRLRLRWREHWMAMLVLVLVLLPLGWGVVQMLAWPKGDPSGVPGRVLAGALLVLLAPGAAVLGYAQTRGLVHRFLVPAGPRRRGAWQTRGSSLLGRLLPVALFGLAAGVLTVFHVPSDSGATAQAVALLLISAAFVAVWSLGMCLAGLVTFVEMLLRSLETSPTPRRDPG